MGLMNKLNFVAVGGALLLSVVMTACGGGGGGSNNSGTTVANVPANYCSQNGVNGQYVNGQVVNGQVVNGQYVNGAYPNGQYGYGNPAPYGTGITPYGYNGTYCANGGVPTCYPNGGGMQCISQQTLIGFGQQGYYPTVLSYNQGLNNYGYIGYLGYSNNGFAFQNGGYYGTPGYYGYSGWNNYNNGLGYGGGYGGWGYGFGGRRGGLSGGLQFGGLNFQFGIGRRGYANNVLQGCNLAAGGIGCAYGVCRPLNNGSQYGICAQ